MGMKIGVMIDSFKTDLENGIDKAYTSGAQGIQIYAVSGMMAPENLTLTKRREILDRIRSKGLVVSALCGDLGGHGFEILGENSWKIEKSKRIMDLAIDLDSNVVTTHIGVIPSNQGHPRRAIMQEACEIIGEYGDKIGVSFAIETGPEPPEVLLSFIESMHCRSIKVNFDPANFVMVTGYDPVKAVGILKKYIVHTHAKDGVLFKKADPEIVYRAFAGERNDGVVIEELFREVPLGEGSVDFDEYLKKLALIGYDGFLTVEREVGEDPENDIRMAVDFLKYKLKRLRM
jgi:L-ribulose-5-phosphate 3-epimerase